MAKAFVISHPEVVVDPARPVRCWHLSPRGIGRITRFASSSIVDRLAAIYTSAETKAVETAQILSRVKQIPFAIHHGLEEIDRSAAGFLPSDEFERTADAFFGQPDHSVRGWERAIDAQARIVHAVERLVKTRAGDLAIVTHGGVGTLLLCRYLHVPITRTLDQPSQGHYWTFDIASRRALHRWLTLENG